MVTVPTVTYDAVYHIGTLNPAHRGVRGESQEGHLLSVSICPLAWRKIVKLGGNPLHTLTKEGGAVFLDMGPLRTHKELRPAIEQWALDKGLLEKKTVWKAWTLDSDCEEDSWRISIHDTYEDAEWEADEEDEEGPHGNGCVEQAEILAGTPALSELVKIGNLQKDSAFDYAALIWAQETLPHLDGVWWNDPYDPYGYTAPRAGIYPHRLHEFSTQEIDWSMAPDEEELIEPNKTAIPVTLKDGTVGTLEKHMAYDGFYNDAIDDLDEDGQKLLMASIRVEGKWVGSCTAGYLAGSHGGHLAVLNVAVDDSWRRKGIATLLYDAVETHYGDTVLPYPGNEGGAIRHFWHERLKDQPDVLDGHLANIGPRPPSNSPSI